MNTVLVVRLSAIGDTIIAARAAQTLIEHGCDVVFLTHFSQRDIVSAIPSLRRFILIDEKNELGFYLKNDIGFNVVSFENFGAIASADVLDLQSTSRSRRAIVKINKEFSLQPCVYRVGKRTVFRSGLVAMAWLCGTQRIREKSMREDKILRVASLQEKLVAQYLAKHNIVFRGAATCYLNAESSPHLPGQSYLLVFVGASFALKSWPKELVRSFMRGILNETNLKIVLCGGKDDIEVASYLAFENGDRVENRVGQTPLALVLSLAKNAQFILSNDSFGAHLADAFKKPAAVVFGATSPLFGFAPREPSVKIHYANLGCSPCARHGQGTCRFKNLKCLSLVTPEEVLKNALQNLPNT